MADRALKTSLPARPELEVSARPTGFCGDRRWNLRRRRHPPAVLGRLWRCG
ncbi:hypothetical protein HMPREF0185_00209 [Brevundimonas diminuta 470-4]|nr:hypothetical protein HMPREF0185_00209 [Brevundimonas diminuta 470-4]